jgi:hypothetical protein
VECGDVKSVSMPLSAADLAYWDVARKCFTIESGEIEVLVGRSSAEITLSTIVLVE